ncbi:MAG: iron chelate uptake ABC transporter family permease subunit, partial [Geminicoccaceae bacterium]
MTDLASSEVATAGSGARFLARSSRRYLLLLAIGTILIVSVLIDMATGPGNLAIRTVVETILDSTTHGVPMEVIVWDIRLPIALMAILVGMMLGAAGAEMQTILNNPLADPFTLGIS